MKDAKPETETTPYEWHTMSEEHMGRVRRTPEHAAHIREMQKRPHHGAPQTEVDAHFERCRETWNAVKQTAAFRNISADKAITTSKK